MGKRITITLLGAKGDAEDVRFSEFVDQLETIKEALKQTERVLSDGGQPSLYYKVVNLSHSSPATITIEACTSRKGRGGASPASVVAAFGTSIRVLNSRKRPPARADLAMLEAYRPLGAAPHIQEIRISTSPKKVISIDGRFPENVDQAIGPDVFANGVVSGKLERINLHNANVFDIYPTVGPPRIRCHFHERDRELAKAAIDRFVTVKGSLRYKTWDKHPYAINVGVGSIDIHERDVELPSIEDLCGIAPDATGDLPSEDFVRSIRDANW